jgi:hypothetical protein
MCGSSGSGVPSGWKRGRPVSRAEIRFSSSRMSLSISRRVPAPSVAPGACACGSHLAHSQCGRNSLAAATTITRSSGECSAASEPARARAEDRTHCASPLMVR